VTVLPVPPLWVAMAILVDGIDLYLLQS
jgi:hypothetical protein